MSTITYTAKYIYTGGAFVEHTYVVVSDGVIVSVAGQSAPDENLVDFGEAALIPAAVNTHTHSFQSLLRGTLDGLALPEWLRGIYSASAGYGPEECYVGAVVSFGEMVRSGTTAVADFFYLNAVGNENARAVITAAKDVGIRLVLGRAGLDAEWAGPGAREDIQTAMGRLKELAAEFAADPYVQISPAPHSIYGASQPMIEAMAQLAVDLDTLWYIHLTDPKGGGDNRLNPPGERSIPMFERWGILSQHTVLVHALGLDTSELELVARRGARISWNPSSGMWFGDGMLDLPAVLKAGVRVGMGTDGAASNNALNMFRESQIGSLGSKLVAEDAAAVSARDIFWIATGAGGEVLNVKTGALKPGWQADFIVLDLLDLSLVPWIALGSHIVNSLSERAVKHVFRAGEQVVRDGRLMGVDEREIAKRASSLGSRPHVKVSLALPGAGNRRQDGRDRSW
jgi:5-methylthioadenosine/S-adenosylhomocysteine deaminase